MTDEQPGLPDLDAAVAACRASGLTGWPLVEQARRVVRGQFLTYSAMTPWETTEVAFRRRRGYSAQYNLALVALLARLGVEAEPVFAARIHTAAQRPWWRNGHVWARVRIDGRVRDVCAGLADEAGHCLFEPATQVLHFGSRTHLNTTLVLSAVALRYHLWERCGLGPAPRFMRRPFGEASS